MNDASFLTLGSGRMLAWDELGDPGGPPALFFHGTGGSRRQASLVEDAVGRAGVRLVVPDRPGYGESTYQRGRTLLGWVDDVGQLADHLGIDRFVVAGYSGGGPHAAVCARFMPDRVTTAAIVSGIAPLERPERDPRMLPFNRLITSLARRSLWAAYVPFALGAWALRRWPGRMMEMGYRPMPEADRAVLARPAVRAASLDDFRTAARTAALAAAQDYVLFTQDWGFRLEDIQTPVHVWHGTEDRNVPLPHGTLQAELIPRAVFHECPGEGHMLLVDHVEEILRTVTSDLR